MECYTSQQLYELSPIMITHFTDEETDAKGIAECCAICDRVTIQTLASSSSEPWYLLTIVPHCLVSDALLLSVWHIGDPQ